MIIHLKESVEESTISEIAKDLKAISIKGSKNTVLVSSSKMKEVPDKYKSMVAESFVFEDDIQLASRKYKNTTRQINLKNVSFGGNTNNTILIAGPCSVESEEQITESAEFIHSLGIGTFRGGCYKPRTSPYSFQGLGVEGLKLLDKMRNQFGLNIITEVRDATQVDDVIKYTDVIQIGAKSMYDHGILRKCGEARKPVLLKRGFGSTLQELVQAAEFILSGGNEQVILCERGIRTFETKSRFTLDLCGAAYLKKYTNLPVVLDPSHAMGHAYGVPDLAKACMAMGVDGLLIEVHPNPKVAKSDAAQQLDHATFKKLFKELNPIAQAIGKNIV